MAASSVSDLHGADSVVAADHFSEQTQGGVSETVVSDEDTTYLYVSSIVGV